MTSLGIEVLGNGSTSGRFDLFICTLGYETRSSHLARERLVDADQKVALAFPEEDYAAYVSNRNFLTSAGYSIVPNDGDALRRLIASAIESQAPNPTDPFSILVDISSMSRPMLAHLVYLLSTLADVDEVLVTFAYLPAKFVRENAEHAPVAVTKPVTPEYAGWTSTPELPITAVVGLGYERDLALGTIEYLEPTAAWVFIPTGEDRRYDDAVNQANRDLKEMISEERALNYNVDSPARVYALLESLTYGLLQKSRPILVPFGPKIFCLCCLLVARTYAPNITVWRVSGETHASPGDREANGKIISLETRFARLQKSGSQPR